MSTSTWAVSGRSALLVGLLLWVYLVGRNVLRRHPPRRRAQVAPRPLPHLGGGHRRILHGRTDVGPAHQPGHRRILALVGGPSVGGGFLRGLRDTVIIIFLFARLKLIRPSHRRHGGPPLLDHLSWPAESSARCITCTSPARRRRSSRSARSSARWRSSRWCLSGSRPGRICKLSRAAPLGAALQVADLLLRLGRVLEHGRRRACSAS